jgi:CBS domain-containing protein
MVATEQSLFQLTAADLMTPVAVAFREHTPLRQAAEELFRAGVHGAPVVNGLGECVGVLSVSDLARWAARRTSPPSTRPQTCSFQEPHRAVRGEETILCSLPAGGCSFQASKTLPGGRVAQVCLELHCVCAEWQVVEMEALPAEDVRNYMTAGPVTADPSTSITALARAMIDACVQRVIVADPDRRPVGVVSATDLVAALAGAEVDDSSPE